MLTIRPSQERGRADHGWLKSQHTFSFGQYYDPRFMGFGPLRVINEDHVAPGKGFATHRHQDMEIISYVLDGALEHKDSLGTGSIIRPGDVQRMTAGTGVSHSEYNGSTDQSVHFLQIWIVPEREGLTPGYEQIHIPRAEKSDQWRLIGSRDGRAGSVTIHQDVDLYAAVLSGDSAVTHTLAPGRRAWLQVAKGAVKLDGNMLNAGDGVAIVNREAFTVAGDGGEVLLFDRA
ncbi:MAG: pirin family protein [Pseudomonadota bacterium]